MTSYRQSMKDTLELMNLMREASLLERDLTPDEEKRREEIAKDLPDDDFKKRYGDKWMQVKMATATNMVKKESFDLDEVGGSAFGGTIDKIQKVVDDKQAMKIDGVMVDTFTASLIMNIFNKVNKQNQDKMRKMKVTQLANAAYKLAGVKEEVELEEKVIHNVEFEFQVDMGIDERDAMEKTITKFAKKHKLYRPERDMAALEKTRRFRVSDYNGGKDVNNFFKDLQRAGVKVIKQRMIGNNKSTSFGEEVELDEGKMQDMWQKKNAKSLSVGPFELIRGKSGVHTIKQSGKVIGDFSYDDEADNFVANMKGMKGQWTGNDIDSLFTHLQKVHKEEVELEEASASADARRAMRRDPDMKQKFSKDVSATDDDKKAASKNIMVQMRKAQSLGYFDVEFQDGKKIKIPAKLAIAVQQKYNAMRKPADKEKFQAKIGKSYRDMLNALKEEAVSPAQQAAIAISKKERGEKPKKESILDRIDRKIKENKNG